MNLTYGVPEDLRDMEKWNKIIGDSAETMARLLDGKLEKVSLYQLRRLKRQLQNFNSTTGKWKP